MIFNKVLSFLFFLHFKMQAETEVKGEVLLNNRPVGPFMHRLSGFVHQDDLFDGSLTVLEHLTFVVSNEKCNSFAIIEI